MKLRGGHSHSLPIKIAVAERGVDEDRVESVELDGEWADVLLPRRLIGIAWATENARPGDCSWQSREHGPFRYGLTCRCGVRASVQLCRRLVEGHCSVSAHQVTPAALTQMPAGAPARTLEYQWAFCIECRG